MRAKITLLTVAAFLCLAATAFAHPPKVMDVSYDEQTSTLTINITHTTTNRTYHFINRIDILVNGRLAEEKTFGSQTSNTMQTYVTRLKNVRSGDSIQVKAYCNRRGQKTASITVE